MRIVDIANEIYIETGSPSTTTVPAIAFWLRAKAGYVNTVLYEDFVVDPTTLEIYNNDGSEVPITVVSILKQLYKTYDIELQMRNLMNSLSNDAILEVKDNLGGTSFTRVNRNEIVKTLIQWRKDELHILDLMITSYRSLTSTPTQVAGDDTLPGYMDQYPSYRPLRTQVYSM